MFTNMCVFFFNWDVNICTVLIPIVEEEDVEYVECFLKDDVSFIIEVHHDWAPLGAARFMDLIDDGYFTNCALFRAVKNFRTHKRDYKMEC